MTLDLNDLVRWGPVALTFAMLAVIFFSMRLHRQRPGIEISVMLLAAVATGPAGTLFRQALHSDQPWFEPVDAWVNFGLVVLALQVMFWASFLQLRGRARAETDKAVAR